MWATGSPIFYESHCLTPILFVKIPMCSYDKTSVSAWKFYLRAKVDYKQSLIFRSLLNEMRENVRTHDWRCEMGKAWKKRDTLFLLGLPPSFLASPWDARKFWKSWNLFAECKISLFGNSRIRSYTTLFIPLAFDHVWHAVLFHRSLIK